jgi:hypothetical protein
MKIPTDTPDDADVVSANAADDESTSTDAVPALAARKKGIILNNFTKILKLQVLR